MATLPGLTYSAPGVPLYAPLGGGSTQSTVSFANTYLWEGAAISTNSIEFDLSAPSTSKIIIGAQGTLYAELEVDGGSGNLTLTTPGNVIIPSNLNISSISTGYIAANDIDVSTISTSQIDIDGQTLNATPTELLLNGIPLASISSLSTIADWSLDPAISTVQMAGFPIRDVSQITGYNDQLILQASTLGPNLTLGWDSMNPVSSQFIFDTGAGPLMRYRAGNLDVSTITASNITTVTFTALSSINVVSTISSLVLEAQLVNTSTLYASGFLSTPDIEVSTINGAQFGNSSITVEVVGVSSLVANSISSIGAEIRNALVSTIQFNPSANFNPNLNVNLGLGNALGQLGGAASGILGVLVGGAALGTGIAALAQTRGTTNINSNAYELVNGTTQLQISTLGTSFSTVYRFVSSVAENVPGEEYFVSSIHSPGVAIRSLSDPLNTVSAPTSTIQSFGQWVALDANVPVPSTVSTFSQLTLTPSTTLYSQTTDAELIVGTTSDPNDLGQVACSALRLTSSIGSSNGTVLYGSPTDRLLFVNDSAQTKTLAYTLDSNIGVETLEVSTINMNGTGFINWDGNASIYEPVPGQLFFTNGAGTTMELQPTQIQFNEAGGGQMLFVNNSLEVAGISTGNLVVVSGLQASTLNANTISTAAVTTSTVAARAASVSSITGLSSIAFLSPGTTYALSSLVNLVPGVGGASQTSTVVTFNTDLSVGTNDFLCGQLRVDAGAAATTSEIVFVAPDDALATFDLATGDETLRIRGVAPFVPGGVLSTGYLLDTTINPPFFSTIANQVNLMAFFPSTTSSTIGVSTISKMNPVNLYGRSTLAGGSVTVVFSPPYANSNEYSVSLTYQDTSGGNPLHANILSVSSFTANGNGTNSFFWQTIGRV